MVGLLTQSDVLAAADSLPRDAENRMPAREISIKYVLRQFSPERLSVCAVYFHSQKGEHTPAVQGR